MKNKGFTLIELLAVIIILAIIALISTPVIMDLINRSRYGAFSSSKRNIERAAELYYARNAASIIWDNDISYVEIKTLKNKKYLAQNVVDVLTNMEIEDDTKVLLYREGRKVSYSLQLYNEIFFDWYQGEMIKAVKKDNKNLPSNVGDKKSIDLNTLIDQKLVDELRLPLELENRCVGYVEIEKITTKDYEHTAYVDCLTNASTFASHYVSYGGKYLDEFTKVIETSEGGYVAIGISNSEVITKYGNIGKGSNDAIIVKFTSNGDVEWSYNFGGTKNDSFNDVVEVSNGYVVVGSTNSTDEDIENYIGGNNDAIIVKFNKQGSIVHKRNFGGTSTDADAADSFSRIIINDNKFVIAGSAYVNPLDGDYVDITYEGAYRQYIIVTMDFNFNVLSKNFYDPYGYNSFNKIIATSGGYIGVGSYRTATLAPVFKVDNNMNLIAKFEFSGAEDSRGSFNDVVEVSDGYIVVGHYNGKGNHMTDLSKASNGYNDAIIIKYDKTLQNIIWKKSFGGSNDDVFYSIVNADENEVIVAGYSKSDDMDMNGISVSKEGYRNAILVRYNSNNGNVISKKVFGGTNSDTFTNIIKTINGNYIAVGSTFSGDVDLQNFNKGHGDGILVSYDRNLNLIKSFKEAVIIIDKLKTIKSNYGTNVNLYYDNIYTSNNPEVDLKNWCTSSPSSGDNNYEYGQCLRPFNSDDMKLLNNIENTPNFKIISAGEKEYIIENEPNNKTNWYQLYFRMQGGFTELSNFKIKFESGYIASIEQSVNDGYLEPLVIVSNALVPYPYSEKTYKNLRSIISTNGQISGAEYPVFYMNLKSKKEKISSFIFTSNRNVIGTDRGFSIYELHNFDMSVVPTQ